MDQILSWLKAFDISVVAFITPPIKKGLSALYAVDFDAPVHDPRLPEVARKFLRIGRETQAQDDPSAS